MAVIGKFEGSGSARHRGGGQNAKGRLEFQLVETDGGGGRLNVIIRRVLGGPWTNSIPVSSIGGTEYLNGRVKVLYGASGELLIDSPQALELWRRLKAEQGRHSQAVRSAKDSSRQSVEDAPVRDSGEPDVVLEVEQAVITYRDAFLGPEQREHGYARVVAHGSTTRLLAGIPDYGLALSIDPKSITEYGVTPEGGVALRFVSSFAGGMNLPELLRIEGGNAGAVPEALGITPE